MQGLKQVHIDAAKLAMRTQGAVTYQIATALQSALSLLLDPEHTLACVLLLCIFTECASRVQGVDVSIARQVLQSQLGLSFMSAIDHVLRNSATSTMAIFLVRTYGLCIPSVLGAVSPSMLANDYVQTAIMSYVYQYAQHSREVVTKIDWGASPIYFCLLCIVIAKHRDSKHRDSKHRALTLSDDTDMRISPFTYVFQGLQLLLLDVLTRTVWESSAGAPKLTRTSIALGVVVTVDLLYSQKWDTLHVKNDMRSYSVLKAAQQINSIELLFLNAGNTCALAILLLCMRSAVVILSSSITRSSEANNALTSAAHAIADVLCVGSINVLLQNLLTESVLTSAGVRFLSVSVTAVMALSIQKILQS